MNIPTVVSFVWNPQSLLVQACCLPSSPPSPHKKSLFSCFSSSGFIFTIRHHRRFPSHTKAPLSATHLTNPTAPPPPRLCFRGDEMTPGLHPGDCPHPLPRRPALMSPTGSTPSWSPGSVGKTVTTGERLTVSEVVRWSVWWRLFCCCPVFIPVAQLHKPDFIS